MMLFEPEASYGARKPNLNPDIVATLAAAHGKKPTPETIFHYCYAVLYAPTYRAKFAEFLMADFPRIPFTGSRRTQSCSRSLRPSVNSLSVCTYSSHRTSMHPPAVSMAMATRIEKDRHAGLRYDPAAQRVYINATQHFALSPTPSGTTRSAATKSAKSGSRTAKSAVSS